MHSIDLDALLKSAAQADWTRIVHRCAWCGRVADGQGRYRVVTVVDASVVCTDGMCPSCGARGLAAVRRRTQRRPQPALAA